MRRSYRRVRRRIRPQTASASITTAQTNPNAKDVRPLASPAPTYAIAKSIGKPMITERQRQQTNGARPGQAQSRCVVVRSRVARPPPPAQTTVAGSAGRGVAQRGISSSGSHSCSMATRYPRSGRRLTAMKAHGYGLATIDGSGNTLDTWYPAPSLGAAPERPNPPQQLEAGVRSDELRHTSTELLLVEIDTDDAPETVTDVYLRLHLLSHRLVRPHGVNLDGIFAHLAQRGVDLGGTVRDRGLRGHPRPLPRLRAAPDRLRHRQVSPHGGLRAAVGRAHRRRRSRPPGRPPWPRAPP